MDERLIGLYVGIIDDVLPPSHINNVSKYQYEYLVRVTLDNYGQLPTRCIRMDSHCGSLLNYYDEVLGKGCRVFVEFPRGERSGGVIIGGARSYPLKQTEDGVRIYSIFNLVEQIIDKDGKYTIQTRTIPSGPIGPNISIDSDKIKIGDNLALSAIEDSIEIDRMSQTITVKCGNWKMTALQGVNITVIGDVALTCKNADVKAANSVSLTTITLDAKVVKEANIKSAGKVNIDAPNINFNGGAGQVLTTLTQPTCYITGIPFKGSPTVKAT